MPGSRRRRSRKRREKGHQLEESDQRANLMQTKAAQDGSNGENGIGIGVENAKGLSSNQGYYQRGSRGNGRAMGSRGRGAHRGNNERATSQSTLPFRNGPRKPNTAALSPSRVQDILEFTLSQIKNPGSSGIDIVDNWATEAGLACVRQIVETDFSQSYSVTRLMFDPHCVLFLSLISYISREDIQNSLILEKPVGTICNVIYGPNGNRGVTFFRKVVGYLELLNCEEKGIGSSNESQYGEVLLHITQAILSILLKVQEATLKSEFKEVSETLWSRCFVNYVDHISKSPLTSKARENMLKVQTIFGTGSVITANDSSLHGKETNEQLETAVDLPGKLSKYGERHDNDHVAISDIRILPTLTEILKSRRPDFLPTRDALYSPDKHHEKGIRRLLDFHFRLLREDTSGVLRDSVRVILDNWETLVRGTSWQEKRKLLRSHCPTPARIYYGVRIKRILPSRTKGMEIDVEFDQVPRAKNMSLLKRKQHWQTTHGLNEGGALLALIDAEDEDDIRVIFLQVSQRHLEPVTVDNDKDSVHDLVSSGERAMVTLHLINHPSDDDLEGTLRLMNDQLYPSTKPFVLVEFPALFYNAFEGILRNLQNVYRDLRYLPFTEWIAPQDTYPPGFTTLHGYKALPVGPPTYRQGWKLDFSSISMNKNDKKTPMMPLQFGPEDNFEAMCEKISQSTTLDMGQARAMVSAFKNRLALIQGPPGTGKSYVGIQIAKCLLAQNNSKDLGPILCVCYTNHALDQFLQGLCDSGISKIVRIGSRSASPLLESLSIDSYKKLQKIPRIPGHGRLINERRNRLDDLATNICHVYHIFASGIEGIVRSYLQRRSPMHEREIVQGALVTDSEPLGAWVDGSGPGDLIGNGEERTIEQLLVVDKWTLTNEERKRLLQYWHKSAMEELLLQLQVLTQKHASEKEHLTSLHNQADAQVFDQVDVVGITTTGLANNADLLRSLKAKVLICEEAGEVLESHVLTTLLPSIEHAILIGDHLQLRPKISMKRLSAEYDSDGPRYNLDESLFERLANFIIPNQNKLTGGDVNDPIRFPVAQLSNQRRMHPSIASLVRGTLYPDLCDHPRTHSYPGVPGFKRRLFWLDHRNTEDPDHPEDPMRSKTNTWEAEMVASMVKHLFSQGEYREGQIAILTPYIGQTKLLKDKIDSIGYLLIADNELGVLDESAEDVAKCRNRRTLRTIQTTKMSDYMRISTVDDFQGDEATVVIVSLVRSNKNRNCGFLKTSNRINVLLSRAKHGMYIIGNADTASSVPMWSSVIRMLEDGGNIGPKLQLDCTRHTDSVIHVSSPEDFIVQAPGGGCSEQCGRRLSCGHTCTFKCHSDSQHDGVKCMKPCTKMKDCGHSCSLKCFEKCGECVQKIPNAHLPCGHNMDIECRYRGKLALVKCEEDVVKKFSGCGHDIHVKCHEEISKKTCSHPCDELLPKCGHTCRKPCSECWKPGPKDAQSHAACSVVCGNPYSTCSHSCTIPCHPDEICPPCQKPCEVRCRHSQCPKTCGEPCAPCAEKCEWCCNHRENQVCNMPCAIPCDLVPCHKRCDKLLTCGHRCPSVCGETCPDQKFCQVCGNAEMLERGVDLLTFDNYGKISLDEDPCVFLSCGHFYTMSSLDGIMDVKEYYNIDPKTNNIISPKWTRRVMSSVIKLHGCPECRRPLREIYRYNRIVKKALLDESTKRFIVTANMTLGILVDQVLGRQCEIEIAREKGMRYSSDAGEEGKLRKPDLSRFIRPLDKKDTLQQVVDELIKSVAAVEQPYGRVNDLLTSAATREDTVKSHVFRVDESQIQTGFQIRGQVLRLLLTWMKLWDYWLTAIDIRTDAELSSELRDVVAKQVNGLIRDCEFVRDSSRKAKLLAQEAEAMVYYTFYSSLALCVTERNGQEKSAATCQKLHEQASAALDECEVLFYENLGTLKHLEGDIELAKELLNGTTFYTFVSAEEKKQVYNAMATQFQGSGHWYYCRNHHPFTVGECGMPMEEARCPQCGAPVGGLDHFPSAGVTSAEDFEVLGEDDSEEEFSVGGSEGDRGWE